MAAYCGVDFHARQQTVCYRDTADGEVLPIAAAQPASLTRAQG